MVSLSLAASDVVSKILLFPFLCMIYHSIGAYKESFDCMKVFE